MKTILENDMVTVEIDSLGAEVCSFQKKADGCEYIWNGDAAYWSGHSPVLFPMVCAANNSEIRVNGERHTLGNHGFARKSEFVLQEASKTTALFCLTANEGTLAMYPFRFKLYIAYSLQGKKLQIEYRVENEDDKEMYFQLGTHAGFNCPLGGKGEFADHYIAFEYPETLDRLFMNGDNVLIEGKSERILKDGRELPLSRALFADGALVFRNMKSQQVALKSRTSERSVTLTYDKFPYLGLWQAKDADFVCIEPWYGIAEPAGYTGEFRDKEKMLTLAPGAGYCCCYAIEID